MQRLAIEGQGLIQLAFAHELLALPYELGLLLLPLWGRALNLLVLGDREARHLGLDTERTRFILIALAALVTGASVAMAGIISFIGTSLAPAPPCPSKLWHA